MTGSHSDFIAEDALASPRGLIAPLDDEPWDETLWMELIARIEGGDDRKGGVIPVAGPDLLTIEVEGKTVPLYQRVAELLAAKQGLPAPSPGPNPLPEVAAAFKRRTGKKPAQLLPLLKKIMADLDPKPSDALRRLAEVRGFRLFISTTPDRLLEQAIDEVRFGGSKGAQSISFQLSKPDDLPRPFEELAPNEAVVVHPFGLLSIMPNSCVLSEEDLLEFCYQFHQADASLSRLLAALRSRPLLFLGGMWNDWVARFFLRNARPGRLEGVDICDYFVGGNFAEASLADFLRDFASPTLLSSRSSVAFIGALRDEWVRQFPPPKNEQAPPPPALMPRHALFLSYAHEDTEPVARIKAGLDRALREAGLEVEVWFDTAKLKAGDQWDMKILQNLKACLFFLPVVSRQTEQALHDRYFRKEWNLADAGTMNNSHTYEFIIPIAVDDPPHREVPPSFNAAQVTLLRDGEVSQDFAATLVEKVRRRLEGNHGR